MGKVSQWWLGLIRNQPGSYLLAINSSYIGDSRVALEEESRIVLQLKMMPYTRQLLGIIR
jgi:hypothetical protein